MPILIVYMVAIALISALETVVGSLSENKLEKQSEDGSRTSARLLKIASEKEKYLASLEVLRFFLIASVAFLASFFKNKYAAFAVIVVFSLVILINLSGRLALKNAEKKAGRLSGLIRFFHWIIFPFVWISDSVTALILKMFRIKPEDTDAEVTEEEILDMIDDGEEDGNIETNEREMVENVFEFNNITASDIMVHRTEMTAVDLDSPNEEILKIINETGYSRVPAYRDNIDNIVGILSTRAFLINLASDEPKKLDEIVFKPFFAPESVRADALFRDMNRAKAHMAVILNEYGGTFGIVTMEDLLEIIFGNIYDETDDTAEEEEITEIGEKNWVISGSASIADLEDVTGYILPEEYSEFTTVSGLVFSFFTSIPDDGETPEIDVGRLHIKVTEITDHKVVSAIVTLTCPSEEE